jgi:hypothetical protein
MLWHVPRKEEGFMSDDMTRRERWAAGDAARGQAQQSIDWGMRYEEDVRQATPERLAYEARERGDHWFQVDVPIAYIQGHARLGATSTRTARPENGDVIGRIEQQGWQLQHAATTFVQRGHASTKRAQAVIATSADDVAVHGEVLALYVFRRVDEN